MNPVLVEIRQDKPLAVGRVHRYIAKELGHLQHDPNYWRDQSQDNINHAIRVLIRWLAVYG